MFHTLNRRFDVYRRQGAPDGSGGQSSVWVFVGRVRGRVSQPRAVEQVEAERAGSRHDTNVYLAPRADVRRNDRLRPAGAAPGSRPYFDVISVVDPSAPVYRRAECELIDAEDG